MIYVGGLRDRLIHDSLYNYIKDGLTAIGWMDTARKISPVTLVPVMKDWEEELAPNTITISPSNAMDEQWELGSFGTKNTTTFWIDVYGQNEALGLQISGDIRDILRGKFTSLGFGGAELPVMDYTQATPTQIFYCDIEHVRRDRAQSYSKRYQRFLYMISVDIIDYYTDDVDLSSPNLQIYGGSANEVYLPDELIYGGNATSDYTITIEGGTASDVDSPDFSVDDIQVDAGAADSAYLSDENVGGGNASDNPDITLSGGGASG